MNLRVLDSDGAALLTRAAGSDKTSFLTRTGIASHGRGVTNVLMVTTSVRVVDWVHSHATSARPRVALSTHGVVLAAGLEEGLVDTATTSGDTDGGTGARRDGLLGTRGETDAGLAVLRVADDGGVVARGTGKGSTVTDLLLDVEDDGTLRAGREGEDVADREGSLLAGVDERAGRDTLSRDEGLLAELVAVGVTEDDGREGSATASVVDDLANDTTDVTVLLGKVEVAVTRGVLVVVGVGLEDATRLPLGTNNTLQVSQRTLEIAASAGTYTHCDFFGLTVEG
jgi:hypothetical protein